MKRNTGNGGLLGTGSHMEKHYYERRKSENQRRSRNKCVNYNSRTKWCRQLQIDCVGPSNPLCKNYNESRGKSKRKEQEVTVGRLVNANEYGVGMVMDIQKDICTIRFHKNNKECKYWIKEVKNMLLK